MTDPRPPRALRVGDRIRDNDPKMLRCTIMTVVGFDDNNPRGRRAIVRFDPLSRMHETRIRLDRIHLDDKPRRSGWSRVQ